VTLGKTSKLQVELGKQISSKLYKWDSGVLNNCRGEITACKAQSLCIASLQQAGNALFGNYWEGMPFQ